MCTKTTERFIHCYEALRNKGLVPSARQFALALNYHPQSWNEVMKGRRDVTISLVESAVEVYQFNPHYLYTGEGHLLGEGSDNRNLRVLAVTTDDQGKENIAHVPVKAMAGYISNAASMDTMKELMTYALPGMEHRLGTFRSFEISGDSMHPTFQSGDTVVCRYLQPDLWQKQLKDDHVYIVVTDEDVVIKRIKSKLSDQGAILLHSDNSAFDPYILMQEDIKELWYVEKRISNFEQHQTSNHSTSKLLDLVRIQAGVIEDLQSKLEVR